MKRQSIKRKNKMTDIKLDKPMASKIISVAKVALTHPLRANYRLLSLVSWHKSTLRAAIY